MLQANIPLLLSLVLFENDAEHVFLFLLATGISPSKTASLCPLPNFGLDRYLLRIHINLPSVYTKPTGLHGFSIAFFPPQHSVIEQILLTV